ncbi:hypothetical protein [Streptomyces sp. 3211.6]|uniref:hypothetical protein n=1 Tax=Streptomyces sp. 3211.6 TaxID=1938845 RepID=UPI000EAC6ADD|nr:hypothetical protein [Streptomyces sp. 3211.6]
MSWPDPYTDVSESWLAATQQVRCGEDFHAVRVPAGPAAAAHARLGHQGPVLASAYTGVWYWLLPVKAISSATWKVAGSRVMPTGRLISIPPATARTGPDVHWIVPPGQGRAHADMLAKALSGQVVKASTRRFHPRSV